VNGPPCFQHGRSGGTVTRTACLANIRLSLRDEGGRRARRAQTGNIAYTLDREHGLHFVAVCHDLLVSRWSKSSALF